MSKRRGLVPLWLTLVLLFLTIIGGIFAALDQASQLKRSASSTSTLAIPVSISLKAPIVLTPVQYPANYSTLANYLLGIINAERANFSLSPVTLSPIQSAQQHADSMLAFGYASHYDTQGFEPYTRYGILGGNGSITENVAWVTGNYRYLTNVSDVEDELSGLQHGMVYGEPANGGHRLNVLDKWHTSVSIGIAYNLTALYFVEDFQDNYLTWTQPFTSIGQDVTLEGRSTTPLNASSVSVQVSFYRPQNLSVSQLEAPPYSDAYGFDFIGGITSCICQSYSPPFISQPALTWNVSPGSVWIKFDLGVFTQADGPGVYTVVLANNGEPIADLSFFYSGSSS